jgi:pyrroline-5-carboxylate reductase
MKPTVAVIGAGSMGEAIIRGLIQAGWTPDDVTAADTVRERLDALHADLGVGVTGDAAEAATGRDVVVVVVKPNHVPDVIDRLKGSLTTDQLVLSVAAGIPIATYEAGLTGIPIVRAMPNTPALLGAGAAGIAAGNHAEEVHVERARAVLGAVGIVVQVPESLIDAVTAVSGSGPAYVFLLSEAMQSAARELGLPEDIARSLVNQTILGAGRMLTETGDDAAILRERVTSPGGTTAAAISAFEAGGFRPLVSAALEAAEARSRQLGQGPSPT